MSLHPGSLSDTAPHFADPPPVILATTFIRKMRGRSQSILIEDIYRNLYVVKMGNAPPDFRCLTNELIGTSLCHALGFAAPRSCFIQVNNQFLNRYPDAWFQTSKSRIRPPSGLHYGTAFEGTAEGMGRPFDVLPRAPKYALDNREQLCGMYLFDIWANHLDRRQKVYLSNLGRKAFRAVFIDHGLLFGGPLWNFDDCESQGAFRRKDAEDVEWRDDVVHAWFEQFKIIIPRALDQVLELVPSEWCTGDLANLKSVLLRRLYAIEKIIESFTPAHQN